MKKRNCFRCGKELQPGGLFYVADIRVLSGFDGILSEPAEGIDQQLKGLLEQAERLDPQELEKDVYEEITLIMCKSCRDRFVDEIRTHGRARFEFEKTRTLCFIKPALPSLPAAIFCASPFPQETAPPLTKNRLRCETGQAVR